MIIPYFHRLLKTLIQRKPMKAAIDISEWNGVIDFAKLKNDKQAEFVIIRATNGLHKIDKRFYENATSCIDNKIPWGAYHFADMTKSAKLQAQKFISVVEGAGNPQMPMVLDVETNNTTIPLSSFQLELFCSQFLIELEKENFDTAIYMSAGFSWFLPVGHNLSKYKLWVADYTGAINAVNGWKNFWMHQFSQTGRVAGITTETDLNRILY